LDSGEILTKKKIEVKIIPDLVPIPEVALFVHFLQTQIVLQVRNLKDAVNVGGRNAT